MDEDPQAHPRSRPAFAGAATLRPIDRDKEEKVRFFIGITDRDWFDYLSRLDGLDEVNFWQPSGTRQFRRLQAGEPLFIRFVR